MAINKISGTTLPAFKFRSGGGIELISAAIKNVDGQLVAKRFKVKELVYNEETKVSEERIRDVAYYDTVIESDEIKRIKYDGNGITLITRDGDSIILDNIINKSDIIVPETVTYGDIVLFGNKNEDGTELKDSGYRITNTASDIESENDTFSLPTSKAVKGYVEGVAKPLAERTQGYNVNEQ